MRIVIIGTYPPRQCGIATFTHDLFNAIRTPANHTEVIAVSDGSEPNFPEEVAFTINADRIEDYIVAARFVNRHYDVCLIQHEYGIFGGEAGHYILDLLGILDIPVVTNLHTVLENTGRFQYAVTKQLLALSTHITVMTESAIPMVVRQYDVSSAKISLVPHGTPVFSYDQKKAKAALGLMNKKVMLSFGFLGPSKGFETAIDAVAEVNEPDFLYIVLGQTHPKILQKEGEAYRKSLMARTRTLGINNSVRFVNVFATEGMLVQYLTACDIYVSPYPNECQISSGTLAFAVGAGAAVISTPYWYAQDLLEEGRGIHFEFGNAHKLADIIRKLLKNPRLITHFREKSREYGEQLTWPKIGLRQLDLLHTACWGTQLIPKTIPLGTGNIKKSVTPIIPVNKKRLSS